MKLFLLLFCIACTCTTSHAAGADECVNAKAGDEREFCVARTRVNAGNCDHILGMGLRLECLTMVKHTQRELIWGIKPLGAQSVHIRGESAKAYNWMR